MAATKPITFDINEMIKLRTEGWGYAALGRYFHKDHTTIIYHCERLGIQKGIANEETLAKRIAFEKVETNKKYIPKKPPKVYKYAHLWDEENINPGKSYKQYLKEALKRPIEKRYHEIYNKRFGLTKLTSSKEEIRGEDYLPGDEVFPAEL